MLLQIDLILGSVQVVTRRVQKVQLTQSGFLPRGQKKEKDDLRSSEGEGTIDKNRMRYKLKSRGSSGREEEK